MVAQPRLYMTDLGLYSQSLMVRAEAGKAGSGEVDLWKKQA